jgi:phosphoribosylaminoimidazole carboxylase PurK protein
MSIQAAQRMGLRCLALDDGEDTPASQVAPSLSGRLDDAAAIARLLSQCSFVTFENEFVPISAVRAACESAGFDAERFMPALDTVQTIQDKLRQRQALARCGVPTPRFSPFEGSPEHAVSSVGFPMVLKSRFGGYDGKGVIPVADAEALDALRGVWSGGGWYAEERVSFLRELAVIAYIGPAGARCFPTMVSEQKDQVCNLVYPSDRNATEIALAAVDAVGGRGLFGVELFELPDGRNLVNEIAPRPHNSGHYTLDWGGVSQFEQHVRLAFGLAPVEPSGLPTCMANLLGQPSSGDFREGLRAACQDAGIRVHWYGKPEARPGRKMGHLNAVGTNIVERAVAARARFYAAWTGSRAP